MVMRLAVDVVEHSTSRSWYLFLFFLAASSMVVSKGMVNSTRWIDDWLQMTMSGRLSVAAKSVCVCVCVCAWQGSSTRGQGGPQ